MAGGWLCGTSSYSNNSDQHKIATEQIENHTTSSVLLRSSNQAAVQLQKGAVTTGLSWCLLWPREDFQLKSVWHSVSPFSPASVKWWGNHLCWGSALSLLLFCTEVLAASVQCYQSDVFTSMRSTKEEWEECKNWIEEILFLRWGM